MTEVKEKNKFTWHSAEIGGVMLFFQREFEVVYARMLQHYKTTGLITSWEYHPKAFTFPGRDNNDKSGYQPSFKVIKENGEIRYIEVARNWTTEFTSKFKKFLKRYPDVKAQLQIINTDFFIKNEQKLKDGGFWI